MSFADTRSDGTVEECLDELNDLMAGLQRYSPTVLAVSMRGSGRSSAHAKRFETSSGSWSGTPCSTTKTETGSPEREPSEIDRYQRLSGGPVQGLGARCATRVSNSSNMSGMLMAIANSRIQRRAETTSTSG
jgi:hypothetical protein